MFNTLDKFSKQTSFPTFPNLFSLFAFLTGFTCQVSGCAVLSTQIHVPGSDIHLNVWTNESAQPRTHLPSLAVYMFYRNIDSCLFSFSLSFTLCSCFKAFFEEGASLYTTDGTTGNEVHIPGSGPVLVV